MGTTDGLCYVGVEPKLRAARMVDKPGGDGISPVSAPVISKWRARMFHGRPCGLDELLPRHGASSFPQWAR